MQNINYIKLFIFICITPFFSTHAAESFLYFSEDAGVHCANCFHCEQYHLFLSGSDDALLGDNFECFHGEAEVSLFSLSGPQVQQPAVANDFISEEKDCEQHHKFFSESNEVLSYGSGSSLGDRIEMSEALLSAPQVQQSASENLTSLSHMPQLQQTKKVEITLPKASSKEAYTISKIKGVKKKEREYLKNETLLYLGNECVWSTLDCSNETRQVFTEKEKAEMQKVRMRDSDAMINRRLTLMARRILKQWGTKTPKNQNS